MVDDDSYYARATRRDRVLACLADWRERQANSGWVPTSVIASTEIGGSEGTRRVRELVAMGHPIVNRQRPGSTEYEYRLDDGRGGKTDAQRNREHKEATACQKCGRRQATDTIEDDMTRREWRLCGKCAASMAIMKGIRRVSN